jgi:hypothetical protein
MPFTDAQKSTMRRLATSALSKEDRDKLEFYLLMSNSDNLALQLAGYSAVRHLLYKMREHFEKEAQQEAEEERISVQ